MPHRGAARPDEARPADSGTLISAEGGPAAEHHTSPTPTPPAAQQEPPLDERRQTASCKADTPAYRSDTTPNSHAALDGAIEQARAAVAHLEATRAANRRRSRDDAPDTDVHNDRPAYWAEPEVEL